jgi:hypothetical protein
VIVIVIKVTIVIVISQEIVMASHEGGTGDDTGVSEEAGEVETETTAKTRK